MGKNTNRTYKDSVIESCKKDGFHKQLWTPPSDRLVPPWVFTKQECKQADKRMTSIIGPPGTMRIRNVMKSGRGDNTHDTQEWAYVYARWCWHNIGGRVYVENVLGIFDVLNILTASTLKIETVCP